MLYKKKVLSISLLLMLIFIMSTSVLAVVPGPGEVFGDIADFITKWLGDENLADDSGTLAVMRIILFILVFTILFIAAQIPAAGGAPLFNNRIATVLAMLIAIMTVLFFPKELLIAMGESYTTVVAVAIFAVPIGAVVYVLYLIPTTTLLLRLARLALLILTWVLLNIITRTAGGL